MNRVPKWFVLVLALVFLLGLAAPVLADEAKGKIKSVDNAKSQFVVTDKDGKDLTFKMDDMQDPSQRQGQQTQRSEGRR